MYSVTLRVNADDDLLTFVDSELRGRPQRRPQCDQLSSGAAACQAGGDSQLGPLPGRPDEQRPAGAA